MYYRTATNYISSMPSERINGEKAIELAKDYLAKAGYSYSFIDEVRNVDEMWVVRASTLSKRFSLKISKFGELLEIEPSDNR